MGMGCAALLSLVTPWGVSAGAPPVEVVSMWIHLGASITARQYQPVARAIAKTIEATE